MNVSALSRSRVGGQIWILLLLASAMGGCIQTGLSPGDSSDSEAADGLGSISGIVTDEELVSIADVSVLLDETIKTTTDEAGAYHFGGVEPGVHLLSFAAAGYTATTIEVDVGWGDEMAVSVVQLQFIGGDVPYFETQQSTGFDTCSVVAGVPSVWMQGWPLCEPEFMVNDFDSLDTFYGYWVDSLVPISGFWGETEWEATQALGDAMRAAYLLHGKGRVDDEDKLAEMYITTNSATSPNRVSFTRDMIYNATNGENNIDNALTCSREGPCQIIAWHHAAPSENTLGFAGFQFQQRYDNYLTAFYHTPLPEEFTILPDS